MLNLNKDDLSAIAQIVKESINGLETDVSTLKEDVSILKQNVATLDCRLTNVESDIRDMKADITNMKADIRDIQVVKLENNVIPRLNEIESCYLDSHKKFSEKADEFESAISDISIMKIAIQKNANDIAELKLKQA